MESLPLGYNHDDFVAVANSKEWDTHLINLGLDGAQRATTDFTDGVTEALDSVKPNPALKSAILTDGSSSVE